ncbi:MAG: amino acid adenylation domain-containing protein [Anaerolineae bacterium]|nr:amino acid adenylation domain-containing protein [Anaerolineae bacterium]
MSATQLLSQLRDLDVAVWVEGEQLRFRFPKDTLTPELRHELAEHKTEILTYLQQANGGSQQSEPTIQPALRHGRIPLSFAQQRLWLLQQFAPENPSYNIPEVFVMRGAVDVPALEQTLNEIVQRHEILRTAFVETDGEPMQVITPEFPVSLPMNDLQHLPQAEGQAEARRLAEIEAQTPFDLSQAPLFRAKLLRLAEEEHVLLLTMHHIIADGWSLDVMGREIETIYGALVSGRPFFLPPLPIQYADFAIWQREWLQGEVLEKQSNYWKSQLSGAPPVLELPTDRPRPPFQTFAGAIHMFTLPAQTSSELKILCRQQGVTSFMFLLAAFKLLLARYTHQMDMVVGTPIANRNHSEIEGLIGFFVNTLALRTDLSGNPTFRELLARVREVTLGAYAHQDFPFEKLVDDLNVERNLSVSPIFQVLFALQNTPSVQAESNGSRLHIESMDVGGKTAKFDLSLIMEDNTQELKGGFEYNCDLFDVETIAQMSAHFCQIVTAVVANPDSHLLDIPLLSESEQSQLLYDWNATTLPYDTTATLASLVAAQAARTPDAVALRYEQQQWSYAQLNQQANQLAHHLISLGVGREARVGILLERSPEMVVALLATLKAGGAYVPLDPAYPAERLAYILQDAATAVLLTHNALRFPLHTLDLDGVTVVNLSQAWPEEAVDDPVTAVTAHNLAYTIYTSGSTGQPKGVAITHANAVALLAWARELFTEEELAGVLAATSICFDLSVFELFLPLSCGGSVILAQNALHLPELLDRDYVTLVNTVPSVLGELVHHHRLPPAVQTINLAGEALTQSLTQQAYDQSEATRVYNLYGPSEDTTYSTFALMEKGVVQKPLIGRPIANTQAYILDSQMQPVPVGVVGELYLGGDGVTRGYLNRPALTAEKYVPDPFSPQPGARLYKTGDLARYRREGQIDFLGRRDHQVKIRGYRIELGEIEAIMAQHPAVAEAVVMAQPDGREGKQLVGYIVAAPEQTLLIGDLRQYLKTRLPEYMVPSLFVELETMPQTPNGKVDRRALPLPAADRSHITIAYVAPRTPTEELIAGIWADILDISRVGIEDNFFELGGHSLMATRIVSRIRQSLQINVPLRALFEAPTVAELAQAVETLYQARHDMVAPPIVPVSRDQEIPLSFAQQRMWFLDQLDPNNPAYNIPVAIGLTGPLDIEAVEKSLNDIIKRHEALRTTFQMVNGRPVQIITPTLTLELPVVDMPPLPPVELAAYQAKAARAEAQQPFNLAEGPLIRAKLMRVDPQQHALLLTFHHIIFDAWSMDKFTEEMIAFYEWYALGKPLQVAELPIQYADYAFWQRAWLQDDVLEKQLDYWRKHLTGAPPLLTLPTDRPRPPVQTFPGAVHLFTFDVETTEAIKALGHQEGVTYFMTLLAIFKVLLARYAGQTDIVVGSPIANRGRLEVEPVIGLFLNTLILRTDLSGNPTFRELLARVREVTLGAYAHEDLPFEKLVEELQPERNLSVHPLFQVMFVLQHTADALLGSKAQLSSLGVHRGGLETGTSKFDITLYMLDKYDGLKGLVEYNTDLFDAATIEQMGQHFTALVEHIVANPDARLLDIPLLSQAEQTQLLHDWNNTALPYDTAVTIHTLFAQQAVRTPEAVALRYEQEQWSYTQLNGQANQLAHHLQSLGVGPESRVGILLERRPEMVVALLATLKAGGAYVPLDPAYPPERLAYILQDADTAVLLTHDALRFPLDTLDLAGVKVVNLSQEWPDEAETGDPVTAVSPHNLAYTIYTSGSTGQPKGVAITHANAVALLAWARELFSDEELAGVLAATSICFDLSVFELFLPLSCGGSVILAQNALHLPELPDRDFVTLVNTVPSAMRELVAHSQLPPSVQTVNLAGEPLTRALSQQVYTQPQVARLYNLYGPSEDTTYSTWLLVERDEAGEPSIGRPIANTQAYILDEQMQPVPLGVVGELYLGGDGVSRGYLNRPGLTAEKYVPDPFSPQPGARLYQTGDLARYGRDGQMEFLGRRDHQVKIRGYRIELGEIEAVLAQHPAIAEVVVMAQPDEQGDKQLVAYLVAKSEHSLVMPELRAYLRQKLPDYMVPTHFVPLAALPQTANGKIDRRALPLPTVDRAQLAVPYAAPRTTTEETLAAIWQKILKVEKVGVRDRFFELGGHSLQAVALVAEVFSAFGQIIPLVTLYENPTIEHMAQVVERHQAGGNVWTPLLATQPQGTRPPFFGILRSGMTRVNFQALSQALGTEQPFYTLSAPGLDGRHPPFTHIPDLAAHYVAAMRTVQPEGPYYLGGYSFGGLVAYEVARQLRTQGEEVALLAILDMAAPIYELSSDMVADGLSSLLETITTIEGVFQISLDLTAEILAPLSSDERLELCWQRLQAANVLPQDADATLIRHMANFEQATVQALASYPAVAQPSDQAMVIFRAAETAVDSFVGSLPVIHEMPHLGWSQLVSGPITVHTVPGDHFSMLASANAQTLAAQLRDYLP